MGMPDLTEPILTIQVGSFAYGIQTQTSDTDLVSIVIERPEAALGLAQHMNATTQRSAEKNQRSRPGDVETTIYELRHFCKLAADGNPNLLDPLFADDSLIQSVTPAGEGLRGIRQAFLHRGTVHRFMGYAESQRQRLLGRGTHQARMPKRPELVAAHGYDTKYAGHMTRLMMQAYQLASEGTLTMPLPAHNRQRVLAIRRGEVSLDEVLAEFVVREDAIRSRIADGSIPLPRKADTAAITDWMLGAQREAWGC